MILDLRIENGWRMYHFADNYTIVKLAVAYAVIP
jgi:hypothetical protein